MSRIPAYACHWVSTKGTEQRENRDAGGVYACEAYTFAVIMDASAKGDEATVFNSIWLNALLEKLPVILPSTELVIRLMSEAQLRLRQATLFQERACFAALLIPHDGHPCTAFVCGDCRIGTQSKGHETQWLTPVHTLEAACAQIFREVGRQPNRHTVTRVLKASRFDPPEVIQLNQAGTQDWVLSTDGYWDQIPVSEAQPIDDCSVLRLSLEGTQSVLSQNDGDNLYLAGQYA